MQTAALCQIPFEKKEMRTGVNSILRIIKLPAILLTIFFLYGPAKDNGQATNQHSKENKFQKQFPDEADDNQFNEGKRPDKKLPGKGGWNGKIDDNDKKGDDRYFEINFPPFFHIKACNTSDRISILIFILCAICLSLVLVFLLLRQYLKKK